MRKSTAMVVAVITVLACLGGTAYPDPGEDSGKDWYAALRLGYWPYTADVEGTAIGREFDKSADFSDLWDDTERLFGFDIEFGKQRWFVNVVAFFQEIQTEKSNRLIGADVTSSELAVNPMIGYRVYQADLGGGRTFAFDLMAGAYYVKIDLEADFFSPVLGNARVDRDLDFWDPMFGARGYYGFTRKLGLGASGQIGGFGVGSELHYQLAANLIYHFTDWFAVSGGYKVWSFDYEDDDAIVTDLEQTLYGPVVGVQFKY